MAQIFIFKDEGMKISYTVAWPDGARFLNQWVSVSEAPWCRQPVIWIATIVVIPYNNHRIGLIVGLFRIIHKTASAAGGSVTSPTYLPPPVHCPNKELNFNIMKQTYILYYKPNIKLSFEAS